LDIEWIVKDFLSGGLKQKQFKWAYSIGTLHMMVDDDDRAKFLNNLHGLLVPGGKCLLLNLGDGTSHEVQDVQDAFEGRMRQLGNGTKIIAPFAPSRSVTWEKHLDELTKAGFEIERSSNMDDPVYGPSMVVYIAKKDAG
jgi:hypothetical protein